MIPGSFGQAGNDRIASGVIGGGIGNESGHCEVSTIGQFGRNLPDIRDDPRDDLPFRFLVEEYRFVFKGSRFLE